MAKPIEIESLSAHDEIWCREFLIAAADTIAAERRDYIGGSGQATLVPETVAHLRFAVHVLAHGAPKSGNPLLLSTADAIERTVNHYQPRDHDSALLLKLAADFRQWGTP